MVSQKWMQSWRCLGMRDKEKWHADEIILRFSSLTTPDSKVALKVALLAPSCPNVMTDWDHRMSRVSKNSGFTCFETILLSFCIRWHLVSLCFSVITGGLMVLSLFMTWRIRSRSTMSNSGCRRSSVTPANQSTNYSSVTRAIWRQRKLWTGPLQRYLLIAFIKFKGNGSNFSLGFSE